jgi:glycosyl transferase family 25
MKLYLINLDRRADRLAAMAQESRKAGLSFTRIAAMDGQSPASQAPMRERFAASGPLGPLPSGDRCCTLSHRRTWEALVESGAPYAAVFEDDVRLTAAAAALLTDAAWIPPGADLIKLEHFGPANQKVLVRDEWPGPAGLTLARLASRHTGAAAYILSRRAAQTLLAIERFDLPVDHLLFNPNNSPVFAALAPWQVLPAVARQQEFVGAKSDIETTRRRLRALSPAYVKRELIRAAYDLKLIPWQLWLVLSGKARLVGVCAPEAISAARSGRPPGC